MRRCVIVDYRGFTPISEAFERLGYRVFQSAEEMSTSELQSCELALYCMFISIRRPWHSWKRKRHLNKAGVPVITWNRDGPSHKGEKRWRLWLLRNLDYFDIEATHTLQDPQEFAPITTYLPNAAWDTHYNLGGVDIQSLRDPGGYRVDVSFFGRISADKFPEMKKRERFFRDLVPRLDALGISHDFRDESMTLEEQRNFIQTSRINLNFHAGCDDNYQGGPRPGRETSWGMPERCFGVPACGGFLLSDHRKHAQDDFSPGEDWVEFSDLDDCVRKIQYYLAHFDSSRSIAEAAYRRIVQHHTYVNRAQALIKQARAWREMPTTERGLTS
jgi:spore maturation protein CgeB